MSVVSYLKGGKVVTIILKSGREICGFVNFQRGSSVELILQGGDKCIMDISSIDCVIVKEIKDV